MQSNSEVFMKLRDYLDEMGIRYSWSHHDPAYTAQDLAMKEHVSGKKVIKPVVVEADGHTVLCALPASCYVDLDRIREELHANVAQLATEPKLSSIFADCDLGAEPPIGKLFGLPTIVDEAIARQEHVTFQAGTHEDAVTMSTEDFLRITQPQIGQFGKPRA
jgi:Ala-tRNA(Pro) deacylase